MNYPLISEYIEAIKAAEDNFKELTDLRPVLGDDGQPVMTSGNFAVVFKMQDNETGKLYALKCFTKEQEGRAESYHQITDALKDVDSPYLVSLRYLDKELFVDTEQTSETEFPVLLMDWVEGKTLDKYLRENLDDKYALEMLAYRFSQLAQWLIPQPFAHGDLKPDNILVREDGTLVLVDYDGMYVPAMKGQMARELGSPDFRHPLRTENDFDEFIDDFPLISILLSLKTVSYNPYLFKKYGASDRLLFSDNNYRDINQCNLLNELYPSNNSEMNILLSLFTLAIEKSNLSNVSTLYFNLSKPFCTKVTVEDWEHCLDDEDGASYSLDRRRIFAFGSYDYDAKIYRIQDGTLVICDLAFNNFENDRHFLEEVYIPSSVKAIGENPFAGCIGLSIICDSNCYNVENDMLYTKDYSQLISSTNTTCNSLELCSKVKILGAYSLSFCRAKRIRMPLFLNSIEEFALSFSNVEFLIIPNTIKSIKSNAFSGCELLTDVYLDGINDMEIDSSAFDNCTNLRHIFVSMYCVEFFKMKNPNVSNLIYGIGDCDEYYWGLTEIENAKEIFKLGKKYWEGKGVEKDLNEAVRLYELASELGDADAKKELKEWGDYWFDGNKAIYSKDKLTIMGLWSLYTSEYEILEGTESIVDNAFCDLGDEIDCSYLDKIVIPSTLKTIGHSPFNKNLSEIICYSPYFEVDNNTLYTNGKKRLIQCLAKSEEFVVPDEVEYIDDHAFYGCKSKKIIIPESVKKMGINPFIEMDIDGNTLEIISYSSKFVIDKNALYEDNTKLISYWGKGDSFSVPNGIKAIGEYAFFASSLRTINMPDTIESIGDCAFGWCFSLEHVLAPSSSAEKFKRIMDGYQDMIRIEDE